MQFKQYAGAQRSQEAIKKTATEIAVSIINTVTPVEFVALFPERDRKRVLSEMAQDIRKQRARQGARFNQSQTQVITEICTEIENNPGIILEFHDALDKLAKRLKIESVLDRHVQANHDVNNPETQGQIVRRIIAITTFLSRADNFLYGNNQAKRPNDTAIAWKNFWNVMVAGQPIIFWQFACVEFNLANYNPADPTALLNYSTEVSGNIIETDNDTLAALQIFEKWKVLYQHLIFVADTDPLYQCFFQNGLEIEGITKQRDLFIFKTQSVVNGMNGKLQNSPLRDKTQIISWSTLEQQFGIRKYLELLHRALKDTVRLFSSDFIAEEQARVEADFRIQRGHVPDGINIRTIAQLGNLLYSIQGVVIAQTYGNTTIGLANEYPFNYRNGARYNVLLSQNEALTVLPLTNYVFRKAEWQQQVCESVWKRMGKILHFLYPRKHTH